jgi:biotin carboxylase
MRPCLEVMVVEGIKANLVRHRRVLDDSDSQAGRFDRRFLERFLPRNGAAPAAA